jgi:phage shock protein A
MGLLKRMGMTSSSTDSIINGASYNCENSSQSLDLAIANAEASITQLRQVITQLTAELKSQELQYGKTVAQAKECDKNAMLALRRGNESLAKENLMLKRTYSNAANKLKQTLDAKIDEVEDLRKNLAALEIKVSQAKTEKDRLTVQDNKVHSNLSNVNQVSSTSECLTDPLEIHFAALEAGMDYDTYVELMNIKAELAAAKDPTPVLPRTDTVNSGPVLVSFIDPELEALRRQMGK